MIRLVALLSCVILVLAGVKNPLDYRILGGEPAAVGQFPYHVLIRQRTTGKYRCGGSILTSRHILTAAHCVYKYSPRKFVIVVGATQLSFGGHTHNLKTAVCHRGYNPRNFANDIAILKTASDIIFNNLVQPIPLHTKEVPDGAEMIVSGWGYTTLPKTRLPDDLQWTTQKYLNNKQCAQRMPPKYKILPTQICTSTRRGHGPCFGDSGGPLVYEGRLAGIVSYGESCGLGYPEVFTRVESYVPWITGFIYNNK